MPPRHEVVQLEERGYRCWVCTCGWNTDWTRYTDQHANAQAVRHTILEE